MAQRLLNLRVRPARVAILINRDASSSDLHLAFTFFSRVWGGRFGQILPVSPNECDELTAFRLGQSRPDFIYGIALDDEHWTKSTNSISQPRGYGPLSRESVKEIKRQNLEEYIFVDSALIARARRNATNPGRTQELRLISTEETSLWHPYCSAMFGIPYSDLASQYYTYGTQFGKDTASDFIALATEVVEKWEQSWLDITAYELNPKQSWGYLPPTIVLVESEVLDLSLFWNLRASSDATHPAWIIPLPAKDASDPATLDALQKWLHAFLPYGAKPEYCIVTSQSVNEERCLTFARQLQETLTDPPIKVVDYEAPKNRLPVIIPYEYETVWAASIIGRKLTLQPPQPRAFEQLGSSKAWFVDLVKDVNTGRAIGELQLPPSPVVRELLNGPCPPTFERSRIPRTSDGSDCLNIRCSGNKEVVKVYLPTGEEILTEILREGGLQPTRDEKRSGYLPVIKRFDGLFLAASAFAGNSGILLNTLAERTYTLNELQGACKFGPGPIAADSYLQQLDSILVHVSDRMKRIAKRRFAEYARRSSPEDLKLHSLLEHWAERNIVLRSWKIGPCSHCGQHHFVHTLNIQQKVVCKTCGHRISLPARVQLGYSLHGSVQRAIREGIFPVVLAGRFLRLMSNAGFLWLPGVKYERDGQYGDIDLVACCDGYLVFGECKSINETPNDSKTWDDVADQFLETARIAEHCRGNLVVLASLAESYPEQFQKRIEEQLRGKLPYLLLDKTDLELGYRKDESGHRLTFSDVIPEPLPEKPRTPRDKPRTIQFGFGFFSSS